MHDAALVGVVEPGADLRDQVGNVLERQRLLGFEQLVQPAAGDKLHGDERVVLALADVVNGDDIGVRKVTGGAELALEPLLDLDALFVGDGGRHQDDLDRHFAADCGVFGEVHQSHRPTAEDFLYGVPPESLWLRHEFPLDCHCAAYRRSRK